MGRGKKRRRGGREKSKGYEGKGEGRKIEATRTVAVQAVHKCNPST